jgi:hypothetical protein
VRRILPGKIEPLTNSPRSRGVREELAEKTFEGDLGFALSAPR